MGDCFQKIGDLDATAEEAPALAKSVRHWLVADGVVSGDLTDCLLSGLGHPPGQNWAAAVNAPDRTDGQWTALWTNGLHIEVGPMVYWDMEPDDPGCPQCGTQQRFDEFKGLDEWTPGLGLGVNDEYHCPICMRPSPVNEWLSSIGWGIGHLCLEFWNWPPLSEQFRTELIQRLSGHKILYLSGKL
ncbi:hypothetical protein [Mycobacteroides abscessus]|uniref:hypothetical protein n=1 Tax=Mycobacteroides abscessus TaxID=36809 RepID=UPI001D1329D9|nr:hypothetical protein [Mycobacteroides abscessus]MDO2970576.1 hypothetical protein [Mycobacteroides abscessus subsp. bolletii]MDO3077961.1 hypothetical protein [Mycobacteroides abscessus subsp. bolletii]UEA46714.1 hypothetical protein LK451_12595 [Mycobacteroides abscessus subsp. abscessus]UEA53310.1 hypothetical protein LK468_00010 [Mycobacteroides abscessus]